MELLKHVIPYRLQIINTEIYFLHCSLNVFVRYVFPLPTSLPLINAIHHCFVSMEICDPRNNITMCPMCDQACSYWKLVTACGTARASHLFDNPATVFFSVFMALWGKDAFSSSRTRTLLKTKVYSRHLWLTWNCLHYRDVMTKLWCHLLASAGLPTSEVLWVYMKEKERKNH